MSLQHIYQAFNKAIYEKDEKDLQQLLTHTPEINNTARIAIYQNNTLGSLVNVLKQHYPICKQLVGDDYFLQIAKAYVAQTPSTSNNLDDYGDKLPSFFEQLLKNRPELSELGYLPDVSQLEWFIHKAYNAPHRPPFNGDQFARLELSEQSQCYFILAEDIGLLHTTHPVYKIWHLHQNDSDQETPPASPKQTQNLIVCRDQQQVHVHPITDTLFQLLSAVKNQCNLVELATYIELAPLSLGELIHKQWITGFEQPSAVLNKDE